VPDDPLVPLVPELPAGADVPLVPDVPEEPLIPEVPLDPSEEVPEDPLDPPPIEIAAVPATEEVPNPITRVFASLGVTLFGETMAPSI